MSVMVAAINRSKHDQESNRTPWVRDGKTSGRLAKPPHRFLRGFVWFLCPVFASFMDSEARLVPVYVGREGLIRRPWEWGGAYVLL